MDQVHIIESIRTPRGKAKNSGGLSDLSPHELLRVLYDDLVCKEILDLNQLDEVILGCVTQQGEQAGNIAKSSSLYAGHPDSVSGLTINRYCSSSLDALNIAYLKIISGQHSFVIAGGIEMMSRVPMLSDSAAIWTDPETALDARIFMMGSGADLIASLNKISREEADLLALSSQQKAVNAQELNLFKSIVPVFNKYKNLTCSKDECIRPNTTMNSLSRFKPSFKNLGTQGVDALQLKYFPELKEIEHIHTPGNSPAMADGASITLLSNHKYSSNAQYKSRATIKAVATVNDDPRLVLSGCKLATSKLLKECNLSVKDVGLFEIHEAFAATIINIQRELKIPEEKLNVNGGVIALGHPMGATGSVMLSSLIDEMERIDVSNGIVATSGAAGAGTAILIERE